jgi:NAD+ synthase
MERLVEKLILWIREGVLSGGCRGVVLGMSGGIDSSLTAVLCKRAFPESTLGIIMPCYSSSEDEEHALVIAHQFSIPTKKVVLDSIFDAFLKLLPSKGITTTANRLAKANLKVRLRMVTLYYFANQLKYMVVGSSNRSEITVGYFTKYGDAGVDIMPLGNLVKKQVRELATFLDIPQEIIDKPPTAGLWLGQTDEGEFGFTYKELDRYIVTGKASQKTKVRVDAMAAASRHKRSLPLVPDF